MNYADTLQHCYEAYPTLFPFEEDVLDHLFFVIGNGYSWINGELVDNDYEPAITIRRRDKERIKRQIDSFQSIREDEMNEQKSYIKERLKELRAELKLGYKKFQSIEILRRHKEAEKENSSYFINADGLLGRKIYPLCDYSKIVNLPDDIKPDWLEAAKRAITFANDPSKFRITESDKQWLDKASDLINKIASL